MIPLYRCRKIEPAVSLLGATFRHVLVDSTFNVRTPIRFRADLVHTARIFFSKTSSQIALWQEHGGILYELLKRGWNVPTVGPHDVRFFVECPKTIDLLDDACQETTTLAVIFQPPSWRGHEEIIGITTAGKAQRYVRREFDKLARIRQLVEAAPLLTRISLAKLLHGRPAAPSPPSSSCAPEPPADAAHENRTAPEVP